MPTLPNHSGNYLNLEDVCAGYGKKEVLHRVSFEVPQGAIVALVGHNGAGKSTILKTIFGLVRMTSGKIALDGMEIASVSPSHMLSEGVTYVPQGNRIFGHLTVRENLDIGAARFPRRCDAEEGIQRVLSSFPTLKLLIDRRADDLSGGQRQTLALASALVLSPRVLLVDEPSLGLSPDLVLSSFRTIRGLADDCGICVLIVEQEVREVLRIADQVVVVRNGQVSYSGAASTLQDDYALRRAYL